MARLLALRAPLAVVALVALTLVAAARVGLGLSEAGAVGGSRAVAAARFAPNGSDAALTVLVGVLVAACFLGPAVRVRRRFAVWGTALTGVSLVATLVALGLASRAVAGWNLVWGLPDLAVPALVGVGLLALARRPGGGLEDGEAAADEPGTDEVEADVPVAEAGPDPQLEPSWSPDAAAGAVWRTAGEAARGAPALGWGSGEEASWPTAALPQHRPEPDDAGPADPPDGPGSPPSSRG